jgi:hypothetical protein
MAEPIGNPASAATLGGVGNDAPARCGVRSPYSKFRGPKLVGAAAITTRLAAAPYLRISRHGPIKWAPRLYSVVLVKAGIRKSLGYFHSRREAIAAASRLCRQLHVTVRGRWSAFYRKIKRAEFEERQARVIARQRKNKISIVNEFELPSRQIARPS